jgi:PDZ domain-containing protein
MNPSDRRDVVAKPLRRLVFAGLLLLAGCATAPGPVYSPYPKPLPPAETGNYQAEPGREPALVADLRAAPPPAVPEISEGKSLASDEKRLRAQSYMHVGTSHFPASDTEARAKAERQAKNVGADRVIFYPASTGEVVVAYYVRFKLPFGATFRDLRPAEMSELGTGGGVAIGSVIDDSPAARANLLTGDIVLKCDDRAIIDRADFQSRLRAKAGHPVTLTIVRNGETIQRVVRLGAMANSG